MKYFTIIENKTTIGFYPVEQDRDAAFDKYILSVQRFGIKGEVNL